MINDNAFVFNRMLGCNTAIYDDVDKKWQFDRVNDFSATSFVKYNDSHFTYLQPIANSKDKDVDLVEANHIIIEESNVYSSPVILEGTLYSLIMSKRNSLLGLVAKDKERKSEFKIKTKQYPYLPIFHASSFTSYSPMKFPKLSSGYNKSFPKKQVSEDVKCLAIKTHIYSVLSMEELTSMKINAKKHFRSEPINLFSFLFALLVRYKFRRRFKYLFNSWAFVQVIF